MADLKLEFITLLFKLEVQKHEMKVCLVKISYKLADS